jgi:hypothetical protein
MRASWLWREREVVATLGRHDSFLPYRPMDSGPTVYCHSVNDMGLSLYVQREYGYL